MDNSTLLWILSAVLILVGTAGTFLPALPGPILVFAGALLGAWIDDFTRIPVWVVVVLGVLTIVAWVVDYVAGMLGAKKVGASKEAILGAALGTILGLMMGLIGVLFMPFVLAVVGEYLARKDQQRALKVGLATWIGLLLGTIAKVVVVFVMLGIFLGALFIA